MWKLLLTSGSGKAWHSYTAMTSEPQRWGRSQAERTWVVLVWTSRLQLYSFPGPLKLYRCTSRRPRASLGGAAFRPVSCNGAAV